MGILVTKKDYFILSAIKNGQNPQINVIKHLPQQVIA
jgi:hypothetical protein